MRTQEAYHDVAVLGALMTVVEEEDPAYKRMWRRLPVVGRPPATDVALPCGIPRGCTFCEGGPSSSSVAVAFSVISDDVDDGLVCRCPNGEGDQSRCQGFRQWVRFHFLRFSFAVVAACGQKLVLVVTVGVGDGVINELENILNTRARDFRSEDDRASRR